MVTLKIESGQSRGSVHEQVHQILTVWLSQDPISKPKYLVTFTVGYDQRDNINAAVKKVCLLELQDVFIPSSAANI